MKLGTEGNHLLPSGSSDGVWGMNLANEKQRDGPAELPACPHGFSREGQRGDVPSSPGHDPARIRKEQGFRPSVGIISASLVGSGSSLGSQAGFRDAFQRVLLQRSPAPRGCLVSPPLGGDADLACFSSGSVLIADHKYCSPLFALTGGA